MAWTHIPAYEQPPHVDHTIAEQSPTTATGLTCDHGPRATAPSAPDRCIHPCGPVGTTLRVTTPGNTRAIGFSAYSHDLQSYSPKQTTQPRTTTYPRAETGTATGTHADTLADPTPRPHQPRASRINKGPSANNTSSSFGFSRHTSPPSFLCSFLVLFQPRYLGLERHSSSLWGHYQNGWRGKGRGAGKAGTARPGAYRDLLNDHKENRQEIQSLGALRDRPRVGPCSAALLSISFRLFLNMID